MQPVLNSFIIVWKTDKQAANENQYLLSDLRIMFWGEGDPTQTLKRLKIIQLLNMPHLIRHTLSFWRQQPRPLTLCHAWEEDPLSWEKSQSWQIPVSCKLALKLVACKSTYYTLGGRPAAESHAKSDWGLTQPSGIPAQPNHPNPCQHGQRKTLMSVWCYLIMAREQWR